MTVLPATWEIVPFDIVALSTVAWLFKLSMSDAEDEGDSPE